MSINKNAVEVLCGEFSFNFRGEFESKVVEITPETATKLLSFSNGNRTLKTSSLSLLVQAIKENDFVVTNNAISFDENFILRDGHHRLKAISMAGLSVKHAVSINIPFHNFQHVDKGCVRSQADIISIYATHDFNFPITTFVVATATAIMENFITGAGCSAAAKKDHKKIEAVINANKKGFEFVVDNFKSCQRGLSNGAVKAAIVCAIERGVPIDKMEVFCLMLSQGVSSGIKDGSNAAYFCRDALVGGKMNNSLAKLGYENKRSLKGITAKITIYFVQHCIQQFMAGKDVNRVVTGSVLNKETKEITLAPFIYAPISVI